MEVDELARLEAAANDLSDSSESSSDEDNGGELFSNYNSIVILDSGQGSKTTDQVIAELPSISKPSSPDVADSPYSNTLASTLSKSSVHGVNENEDENIKKEEETSENNEVHQLPDTNPDFGMPTIENLLVQHNMEHDNSSSKRIVVNSSFSDLFTSIQKAHPATDLETIEDEDRMEEEIGDEREKTTLDKEEAEEDNMNYTIDNSQEEEYTIHEDESESSSSDEEDYTKDFETANELADNYLDHLTHFLSCLQGQLERNLARQSEVESEIHDIDMVKVNRVLAPRVQHVSVTKRALTIFGYPYFKDQSMFHPPPNLDMKTKEVNRELDVWIDNPRPFSKDDKNKLKRCVREDAIKRRLVRVEQEKDILNHQMRAIGVNDEDKARLVDLLRLVEFRERQIQGLPDSELFSNRFQDYDWDKISVVDFESSHSPKDCELQWKNLLHPDINRGVWPKEEDQLLRRLSEATQGQDWDAIARELGTGRTPHQCIVRYMTRHNVALNNRKWEKSEDERLRRLVAHCRINNFIPWAKVSYYMDRRTKDQCYQRFVYSLKDSIRKGIYTDAEDMMVIIGHELYGNDWAKICEMLPCRTPVQLHCRWNSFIRPDFRAWTQDEDHSILELVRKHGLRDWVSISQDLKVIHGYDRTRHQTRQRFQYIYKTFKKNPVMALENITYTDDPGIAKKRQDHIYKRLNSCYEEWKNLDSSDQNTRREQQGRYAGSGHIELPDGKVVENKDLNNFIRYIQTFLPEPETPKPLAPLEKVSLRTLPEHEDVIFKRPLISRKRGSFKSGRPMKGGLRRRGKRVTNRDRLGHQAVSHIDREIAKFFRPTWVVKKTHLKVTYSDKEVEMFTGAAQIVTKILSLSKMRWEKGLNIQEPEISRKELQIFLSYQSQVNEYQNNGSIRTLISQSPLPVTNTPRVRRTYGKKSYSRSQVDVTPLGISRVDQTQVVGVGRLDQTPVDVSRVDQTPVGVSRVDLMPPNQATMLAFRGVLLRNQYLQINSTVSQSVAEERNYVDSVVGQGVADPDISREVAIGGSDETIVKSARHLEADKKLVNRFLQLFFWPAKMSSTAPPKQEKLFDDSSTDDERDPEVDISAMLAPAVEISRPVQQFDVGNRKRRRGLGLQPPPKAKRNYI